MRAYRIAGTVGLLAVALGCASGPAVERDADPRGETTMDEYRRDPAELLGVDWQWHETVTPVERIEVDDPSRYTIRLAPGGELSARFDCNRGGGTYEIDEGRLSFGPLFSTKMACPSGSLDARFAKDLGEVTSFFLRGEELFLELPADAGTLRFRRAG